MIVLRGTSIIEIVIATALISIAIIAALSLTNNSQKQNTYAKGLAEANKYTTQAADWIRTQRNTIGYATLASIAEASSGDSYCLNTFPADFTLIPHAPCASNSYISGTLPPNIYQRQINLVKTASNTVKILITVSWMENSSTRVATIEMELSQW